MIEIDARSIQDAIKKIRDSYNHVSGQELNKAISNALNRAASQSKTAAGRQIRESYNVSASRVNQDMKIYRSSPKTLISRIVASGSPLSLTNFGAKQEVFASMSGNDRQVVKKFGYTSFDRKGNAMSRITRNKRRDPKSGVSFEIKKGYKKILPTAFIQTANGGITVFARGKYNGPGEGFDFAKERLPIAKLTTSSIPLMFGDDQVMNPVGRKAVDFFTDRVDHEINFILGKIT